MDQYLINIIFLALVIWTVVAMIFLFLVIWLLMKDNDEKPYHYPEEVNWFLDLDDHELRLSH